MSAVTINFHLAADAPAPRMGGPYHTSFALELTTEEYGARVNVFASDDQLAAIAKAILAHLEKQEASDFETEVA